MSPRTKGPLRGAIALLIAALAPAASGCASATASSAETDLRFMLAGVRVTPPEPGRNTVYVEFQDQTGQGGEFEDRAYGEIREGVKSKGYVPVKEHGKADYVLWATVRIFGTAGTKEGDAALANLGAIAGGAAAQKANRDAPVTTPEWTAWSAGRGLGSWAVGKLTMENAYQMVIDLQLARRIPEGVRTDSSSSNGSDLRQATVSAGGGDAGRSAQAQQQRQQITEQRVHFEMEQRVLATASGTRLKKSIALEALIPKVVGSIKSALPRTN